MKKCPGRLISYAGTVPSFGKASKTFVVLVCRSVLSEWVGDVLSTVAEKRSRMSPPFLCPSLETVWCWPTDGTRAHYASSGEQEWKKGPGAPSLGVISDALFIGPTYATELVVIISSSPWERLLKLNDSSRVGKISFHDALFSTGFSKNRHIRLPCSHAILSRPCSLYKKVRRTRTSV